MATSRTAPRSRLLRLSAVGLAGALVLSACAESQRSDDTGGGSGEGGTFVFGAAGAPALFDPFFASDGETFRVSRQIFEGLVGFEPAGVDVEPELATDWESSEDGLTWTFNLQENVTFHDGTPFNAEAVCFNFDRWYNQEGTGQNPAISYYWNNTFGGFSDGESPSLFESCSVEDDSTAVIQLTRATGKFPSILGLPSFSMQSPTALEEYEADNVRAEGDSFVFSDYAREHPTGTGPFQFASYDEGNATIELTKYDEYWDAEAAAKIDNLIFRIIPDETTRRQELQSGGIDGYDLPNPADYQTLQDGGNKVEIRDPFNILYLGISQKENEALRDVRVRKALAHAIDREELVTSTMPAGAEVATQFYPESVEGYADDVETYAYDPELAEELLAEAGASDLTVEFHWPTEVTRPYMPNPQTIFNAISEDLEAVGITVEAVSTSWNGGYTERTNQGDAQLFLLGWTGDYNTADNFIGTFFTETEGQFFTGESEGGEELSEALQEADAEPDDEIRAGLYEDINRNMLSDWMPSIPLSHSPPAIVVGPNVEGLVTSPLTAEEFNTITVTEE
ncbi:ABC transporter substrate-binding protein [Actinoalloteichus hymeniacidonis]|uniref:ABC-type dipeptide transport system, periplasmic component n=1 Tax=Actinoalloteichus hymeniacidonis TaxID=340345 RepID=A0AAC9HKU7_9PSEU|nr:ABC transporter substrate-binding protein [Actinoalloteichus hymeniacidonis]AOS61059.1 ABC-type dipeptide transport system, periplasmic component [Actinoalloteichus hymeniacidonis]MBB5910941.1 peptide/nickel transport system substrate-binding protein [Actinoalloteichus hymeniacidonis]